MGKNRKELLFITPQFPYPLDNGGKIGAYNGIQIVSADYAVVVLSFSEEPCVIEEGISFLKGKFPNVNFEQPIIHDIHIRKKPMKLAMTMIKNYVYGVPYVSAKFMNKQMFNLIDRMFSEKYWDIVFIDYLNMGVYGEYIQKKYYGQYGMLIFKDHNIEYEIVMQEASRRKGLYRKLLEKEFRRTKHYEENIIKHADKCFSVCEENTAFLKKSNIHSYTMRPAFEPLPGNKALAKKNNILYIGNLSWRPNMNGLKWFVDQVLPRIEEQVPDVVLTVVGGGVQSNPFENNSHVNYLGYVRDTTHVYEDQKVFIVPLFEGSGIRIKILEAFNHEIPVVSTFVGCNTIGADNGVHLLAVDDKEQFANAVLQLLEDADFREKMCVRAKKFFGENYSVESRIAEFKEIMDYAKERNT